MTLGDKRRTFTYLLAKLIMKVNETQGYACFLGDVFAKKREPPEHSENSFHYHGLAADVNLFKDGDFLTKTEDHKIFGEWWERLHPECTWGGRFGDGNHYSFGERKR